MSGGTIVAWWGAVLGTVGTAIHVWNFWRDRPRVKVSVKTDMRLTTPNPFSVDPNEDFIVITASNMGKHPVYLSKAWVTLRTSPKSFLLGGPTNFKTEKLEPGLSRDFIGKESGIDVGNLKEAWVCDAVNHTFKCKIPRNRRKTKSAA